MESLLDYLLYALFGHNVTSVEKSYKNGYNASGGVLWVIGLESHVFFTLDDSDLLVIRELYEKRKKRLDAEERARYKKIFDLCV